MLKKILFIIISLMAILIIFAVSLSLREKFLEMRINKLNRAIRLSYDELQNLKAEWNYLNNKEYLKSLVDTHIPDLKKDSNFRNNPLAIDKIPLKTLQLKES
ncbi:hypothetical protein ABSA28_01082 [Candidatus Hepatincolaceae symbiont of Richtersius coronifer]